MTVKNWIKTKLIRFSKDTDGAVSIEFVFIYPVLLVLWLGSVSVLDMENASTEVSAVTSTVADILAQAPLVNEQTIDDAFLASQALIGASRQADFQIYVTGLRIEKITPDDPNSAHTAIVIWSRSNNLTTLVQPAVGSTYVLDPGLLQREGFIVASHGMLRHTPLFNSIFDSSDSDADFYEYRNYFAPRNSLETECESCES